METYVNFIIVGPEQSCLDEANFPICNLRKPGIKFSDIKSRNRKTSYRTATATPAVPPPATIKSKDVFANVAASTLTEATRRADRIKEASDVVRRMLANEVG